MDNKKHRAGFVRLLSGLGRLLHKQSVPSEKPRNGNTENQKRYSVLEEGEDPEAYIEAVRWLLLSGVGETWTEVDLGALNAVQHEALEKRLFSLCVVQVKYERDFSCGDDERILRVCTEFCGENGWNSAARSEEACCYSFFGRYADLRIDAARKYFRLSKKGLQFRNSLRRDSDASRVLSPLCEIPPVEAFQGLEWGFVTKVKVIEPEPRDQPAPVDSAGPADRDIEADAETPVDTTDEKKTNGSGRPKSKKIERRDKRICELYDEGMPHAEIATTIKKEELGLCSLAVSRSVVSKRNKVIRDMAEGGMADAEITKKLRCSLDVVQRALNRQKKDQAKIADDATKELLRGESEG